MSNSPILTSAQAIDLNARKADAGRLEFQWPTPLRAIARWIGVFWPLFLTIWAGAVIFPDAIKESILSTPHPQLVYGIFAVAAITVIVLARLMHVFSAEHSWLEALRKCDPEQQQAMLQDYRGNDSLKALYHLLVQTRGLPLRERQVAIENELIGTESQLMSRLSVPNFLSGALVGLGLVGTFIGLLGALQDLSGVFSAMTSGTGGNDPTAMFITMIERLKAPMQGMGTAFVASLYGLLGSLVLGLISSGVKRSGDRMMSLLRVYLNSEVYTRPVSAGQEPQDITLDKVSLPDNKLATSIIEQQSNISENLARLCKTNDQFQVALAGFRAQFSEMHFTNQRHSQAQIEGISQLAETNLSLNKTLADLSYQIRISSNRDLILIGRKGLIVIIAFFLITQAAFFSLFIYSKQDGKTLSAAKAPESSAISTAPPSDVPVETVRPLRASKPVDGPTVLLPTANTELTPNKNGTDLSSTAIDHAGHVVQRGDSLWLISQRHGLTVNQLLDANPTLTMITKIQPGQVIALPIK
jgi:LysM repeat protein/flagellar motor component MotA